jgi:hypothetical protein
MKFNLRRIIIFTPNVPMLLGYYSDLMRSEESSSYIDEDGKWGEIRNENINIAFHFGKKRFAKSVVYKLVFQISNTNKCKARLEKRGFRTSKMFSSGKIEFFEISDPDGNIIQFSNRK